jgi:hypothetical protein
MNFKNILSWPFIITTKLAHKKNKRDKTISQLKQVPCCNIQQILGDFMIKAMGKKSA